jgi:hypothetical protein
MPGDWIIVARQPASIRGNFPWPEGIRSSSYGAALRWPARVDDSGTLISDSKFFDRVAALLVAAHQVRESA